jgi:acyl carrier protein
MTLVESLKADFFQEIYRLFQDKSIVIDEETPLIGSDSVLDSMKLVELCLALEDKAQSMGFEFDWTSDAAMSRSRSMFRTAGSLLSEYIKQMEIQK